jgi:small acid-soluble spore protein H (minor)
MEVDRANEIMQTSDKIDVQLNGQPVWIDSVNLTEGTVTVHPEEQPNDTRTVRAAQLKEVH